MFFFFYLEMMDKQIIMLFYVMRLGTRMLS